MGERLMALSSLRVTGEACEELPPLHRLFMWHTSHKPRPPDGPRDPGHDEGPRGTDPRGPSFRQHRRQGSAGALGAAPGGCAAGLSSAHVRAGGRRAYAGGATGLNLWRLVGTERHIAG